MATYRPSGGSRDDRPSLDIDEKVVWLSDSGPEYGYVRWLGKLPDLGKDWMAGVEFDNPVGSGTGLYRDRQLFTTRMNHASLVPIIGLIKASDYEEPPTVPLRQSSINLIDMEVPVMKNYHDTWSEPHHPKSQMDYSGFPKVYPPATKPSHVRIVPVAQEDVFDHTPYPNTVYQNERLTGLRAGTYAHGYKSRKSTDDRSPMQSPNWSGESPIRSSPYKSEVESLLSAFERASVSERRVDAPDNLAILPEPALVVPVGEKNPALFLKDLLGKSRGIQGHNNSCYLDATLFAMFSSTTLFDSLLYRPRNRNDIPDYSEIQRILRDDIVRPLRSEYMVSADQVMSFRTMLERSSTVEGLTDEEKDPEEFLTLLLISILKAEPYLKLSSGLESFFYQLIVDKDESVVLPTVQNLFEQSFMNSTVRLREIPPCLMLQMPRFGRQYKMYSRIMPSLRLDITDVLESAPRPCGHRGKDCDNLAVYECKDCYSERPGRLHGGGLANITYCYNCFQAKHFGKSHSTGIEDHARTKTILDKIPQQAISRYSNKSSGSKDKEIPRIYMDLFAVLCIETSHYVCFVKCGNDPDAPWCFFDSMADRKGEQNGYNIPEVSLFDEFGQWTSERGASFLLNHSDDKLLPDPAKRLLCDAYLCFYQYPGLLPYR